MPQPVIGCDLARATGVLAKTGCVVARVLAQMGVGH
jgi:hypothetical protein